MAVTPTGDVAVTEPRGVAVFNKDGVKLKYIDLIQDLPHGVAADCAGFIYVPCRVQAESHTSVLIKYTTPDLNQEKNFGIYRSLETNFSCAMLAVLGSWFSPWI